MLILRIFQYYLLLGDSFSGICPNLYTLRHWLFFVSDYLFNEVCVVDSLGKLRHSVP